MNSRYFITDTPPEVQIARTKAAIEAAQRQADGAVTEGVRRYWESVKVSAQRKLAEMEKEHAGH